MATSGGLSSDTEWFDVSDSPDTATELPEFQSMNVCRVAALSLMLGNDRSGARELASELEALGFTQDLREGRWSQGDVDVRRSFEGLSDRRPGDRIHHWKMVGETAHPREMVTFLVEVLGSRLERESVAAAAALWRHTSTINWSAQWMRRQGVRPFWERLGPDFGDLWWIDTPWILADPLDLPEDFDDQNSVAWNADEWVEVYQRAMLPTVDAYEASWVVRMLAVWNLHRALRSPDPVARSLAGSVFALAESPSDAAPTAAPACVTGVLPVSAMIHGTWGWNGDWWRPQSEFHTFVLETLRSNLYNRLGTKFSWSGAYREDHRERAATDFHDWAQEVAPDGLQTVFAHSYGGDVASRAALKGTSMSELVLLSVPVTSSVEHATDAIPCVIDIRLPFDPVLALAWKGQRITSHPNVIEVVLERWTLDHGATHRASVWREQRVAQRAGINLNL